VEALDAFGEATYKGLLFIANGAGAGGGGRSVCTETGGNWVGGWVLSLSQEALSSLCSEPHGRVCPDCRLSPTPGSSRWVSHRSCARGFFVILFVVSQKGRTDASQDSPVLNRVTERQGQLCR